MSSPRLTLASSSPFRKALLEKLQIPFESTNPDIDESPLDNETPIELVERLAIEKARVIASQSSNALVIGSDQVALHGEKIVGKPHNHENAVAQLREASGKSVQLYTGLALVDSRSGEIESTVISFKVHLRELSDQMIENYLHKEQPYNCAGSIKSEALGIALIKKFEGDDPNALIGLPLIALVDMLNKAGVSVI